MGFYFNGGEDGARLLHNRIGASEQEVFTVILLDSRNHVILVEDIFKGGWGSVTVDQRPIFKLALLNNARKIVVAHNHPCGCPNPSDADISVTRTLVECGVLMDINVVDHIITTPQGAYYSFAENGLTSTMKSEAMRIAAERRM